MDSYAIVKACASRDAVQPLSCQTYIIPMPSMIKLQLIWLYDHSLFVRGEFAEEEGE